MPDTSTSGSGDESPATGTGDMGGANAATGSGDGGASLSNVESIIDDIKGMIPQIGAGGGRK